MRGSRAGRRFGHGPIGRAASERVWIGRPASWGPPEGTWWLHGAYMVVTWWLHGGYMVVTWWLHGGCMVVTPTWFIRPRALVESPGATPAASKAAFFDLYTVPSGAWYAHMWCVMVLTWWLHSGYMVVTWWLHGGCMVVTPPPGTPICGASPRGGSRA